MAPSGLGGAIVVTDEIVERQARGERVEDPGGLAAAPGPGLGGVARIAVAGALSFHQPAAILHQLLRRVLTSPDLGGDLLGQIQQMPVGEEIEVDRLAFGQRGATGDASCRAPSRLFEPALGSLGDPGHRKCALRGTWSAWAHAPRSLGNQR